MTVTLSGLLFTSVHLLHLLLHSLLTQTDSTYTVGRSIRDLRRRVSSCVIFVARSWCSFNVCFYFYHYLVACTTLLLFSYCSTGALGITPNLRSYRTLVRAGHGKTLYLVIHTHIMNESIIKQITLLSTCIVLSVFPPYTCNNNMYTSYLYIIAEFPTICKASAKLEDLLLSLNFIVFKKIFLIQYS